MSSPSSTFKNGWRVTKLAKVAGRRWADRPQCMSPSPILEGRQHDHQVLASHVRQVMRERAERGELFGDAETIEEVIRQLGHSESTRHHRPTAPLFPIGGATRIDE